VLSEEDYGDIACLPRAAIAVIAVDATMAAAYMAARQAEYA